MIFMDNLMKFYFGNLSGFKRIVIVVIIYSFFIAGIFGIYTLQVNHHIQSNLSNNESYDDVIYFYSNELSINKENFDKINQSLNSLDEIQLKSDTFLFFDLYQDNTPVTDIVRIISLPIPLPNLEKKYSWLFNIRANISSNMLESINYFSFQNSGLGNYSSQEFNFTGKISAYENFSISGTMINPFSQDLKHNISSFFKTIYIPHFINSIDNIDYIFVNFEEFMRITAESNIKISGVTPFTLDRTNINFFSLNKLTKLFNNPSTILFSPYREISYQFLFENGIHSNFTTNFYTSLYQMKYNFTILIFLLSVIFIVYFGKILNEIFFENTDYFRKMLLFGDKSLLKGKLRNCLFFKIFLYLVFAFLIGDSASLLYLLLPEFNLQNSVRNLIQILLIKDLILILILFFTTMIFVYILTLKSRILFNKLPNHSFYSFNVHFLNLNPLGKLILAISGIIIIFIVMTSNYNYYIYNGMNNPILENFIINVLPYISIIFFSMILSSFIINDIKLKINKLSRNSALKFSKWSDSEKILTTTWLKRKKDANFNLFYVIILIFSISLLNFNLLQECIFIKNKLNIPSYPSNNFLQYSKLFLIFIILFFIILIWEYLSTEKHVFQDDVIKKYFQFGADVNRFWKIKKEVEICKLILMIFILVFVSFLISCLLLVIISLIYFKPYNSLIFGNLQIFSFF